MTTRALNEVPSRQATQISGIADLITFVLAIFANFLAIEASTSEGV